MISSWKNNLLSLPDAIFFDIMRNYLGDLKTPFNKHDLMRSLTSMIMKKEVQSRLFELIDEEDSRLLTAVCLLKSPTISDLFCFTKKFYSFLDLYNRVENLQQRLLLCIEYPEKSGWKDEKIIRVNPLFEEELKEKHLSSALIFPSTGEDEVTGLQPWYNEQLISAFVSFLLANKSLLKNNGNTRKKADQRFSEIFSSVEKNFPENISLSQLLLHSITSLNFADVTGNTVNIHPEVIQQFGTLEYKDRMVIIAASVTSFLLQEKDSGRHFSSDAIFPIISALLLSFKRGTRISREDLSSVLYLINRDLQYSSPELSFVTGDAVIESLCLTGYLSETENSLTFNFNPFFAPAAGEKLRIQSNSEISAPAGFPIAEEVTASLCSEISSYDITRTYSIEKKSFASALESGLSLEKIISRLEETSSGSIPQNILFSFKAWEKEYRSISLNYGIVMTVSADRLPLIKHTPGLKEFFLATPAPGVFILDPLKETEWRRAFADAGFDILPELKTRENSLADPVPPQQTHRDLKRPSAVPFEIKFYDGSADNNAALIINQLTEKINRLPITSENKHKLTARSQKKLILSDSQLKASDRPEERGEAGGLDHRAKIRLTERALELENLLEVTIARDLELEKKLIKPMKLVKTENTSEGKPPIFIIDGIELPEEQEVHIRITRISYLKMLKSSLYTP